MTLCKHRLALTACFSLEIEAKWEGSHIQGPFLKWQTLLHCLGPSLEDQLAVCNKSWSQDLLMLFNCQFAHNLPTLTPPMQWSFWPSKVYSACDIHQSISFTMCVEMEAQGISTRRGPFLWHNWLLSMNLGASPLMLFRCQFAQNPPTLTQTPPNDPWSLPEKARTPLSETKNITMARFMARRACIPYNCQRLLYTKQVIHAVCTSLTLLLH